MQRAIVLGHAVAPAKHETMEGCRLLIVQPLGPSDRADGEPYLVVDPMAAGVGEVAIISSDGKFAQESLGKTTPVRFMVLGTEDERGR